MSSSDFQIVVTGFGSCVLQDNRIAAKTEEKPDAIPWLLNKKMFKFMGKQDILSVISCGRAIEKAGLKDKTSGKDTGLFLSVGYIPFERETIDEVTELSTLNGEFSSVQFSDKVMTHFNPLITFKCLPNMPIFHTSLNFGIQGRYFISYPGIGQFYSALEEAISALKRGDISVALAGGVADQKNFLVEHHFGRLGQHRPYSLIDCAGFICLESLASARARNAPVFARLENLDVQYAHFDILNNIPQHTEDFSLDNANIAPDGEVHLPMDYFGPASMPLGLEKAISLQRGREFTHTANTTDNFALRSSWILNE